MGKVDQVNISNKGTIFARIHDGLIKMGVRSRKNSEEILEYQALKDIVDEMTRQLDEDKSEQECTTARGNGEDDG